MDTPLPPIPAKRYFTVGEVAQLCALKPHVLRYWEQEFSQLRAAKRPGSRRYYQHHEVLMIRRIRELLYDQGLTIHGARHRLQELSDLERYERQAHASQLAVQVQAPALPPGPGAASTPDWSRIRAGLLEIRKILTEP